jgi:hypothetical protein
MDLEKLIGKTINKVYMDEGKDLLIFDTSEGLVGFTAEGDCCSTSYFYELTGIDKILGQKIEVITDISKDMPVVEAEYEVTDVYGYRISAAPVDVEIAGQPVETSRSALVVFRNDNNGYYGGWIHEYEVLEIPADAKEVISDWHMKTE